MIVYDDLEAFKKDIDWLVQKCSLPYFATSRLSKFKHHQFIETLKNATEFNPSFVKNYYDDFFKEYNLIKPKWSTTIQDESFPTSHYPKDWCLYHFGGKHLMAGNVIVLMALSTIVHFQTIPFFHLFEKNEYLKKTIPPMLCSNP